jgi:hypothetical protein
MKKQETKEPETVIDKLLILNGLFSYFALVILAALAYEGIRSLVDAKPAAQTFIAVILIVLLVKAAIKK